MTSAIVAPVTDENLGCWPSHSLVTPPSLRSAQTCADGLDEHTSIMHKKSIIDRRPRLDLPSSGYWITGPDEAEITFMVADDYQKQGIGTAMLNHLCSIARQADLKRLYALAIPDNEGAPRLLNKLGFPCDIRRDPAQRIMHITVHLTSAAPTEELANSQ
jgi:hypothetical protein